MKLAEGICEGALLKDYAVYKKSINEWMIPLLHSMNNNTKILQLLVAKKMQLTGLFSFHWPTAVIKSDANTRIIEKVLCRDTWLEKCLVITL